MNKPAYFPSDSSEAARAKSESQRSFESKPQDPKWKHFVHVPDPIFSLPLSLSFSLFFFTRSESGQIDRDSKHTHSTRRFPDLWKDSIRSFLFQISPPSHQDLVDLCAF